MQMTSDEDRMLLLEGVSSWYISQGKFTDKMWKQMDRLLVSGVYDTCQHVSAVPHLIVSIWSRDSK